MCWNENQAQAGISNDPFLLDLFAGISHEFVAKDFDVVELIYL